MNVESDSLIIWARVKPRSNRNYLSWEEEEKKVFLCIEVKSPPTKGKANHFLLKMIKKKLKTNVHLIKGQTSSDKLLNIENMTLEKMKGLLPKN
ncbi:MAG: DUF167 domain-containing protein [Candidatus Hodarchaeales archaeon]|jgi:uncharacterized protein (TIGR00251 family)